MRNNHYHLLLSFLTFIPPGSSQSHSLVLLYLPRLSSLHLIFFPSLTSIYSVYPFASPHLLPHLAIFCPTSCRLASLQPTSPLFPFLPCSPPPCCSSSLLSLPLISPLSPTPPSPLSLPPSLLSLPSSPHSPRHCSHLHDSLTAAQPHV